jgi:two-component sensor histidine kinase
VSNSFKYAFPNGNGGEIRVQFAEESDQALKLVVCDNGVGFSENDNPEESDSLGLKLVRSLTEQLSGELGYRNQGGFVCEIRIPRAKS